MSEFACDYKIYRFGKADEITNKLFNQDVEFISDLTQSVATNDSKLKRWMHSHRDGEYGEYIVVEIESNQYLPEGGRVPEPIKMIYYIEDNNGSDSMLIDGVDHDHQQKWMAHLMPETLADKLNWLRKKFPGKEINEDNYEDFIELAENEHINIIRGIDVLA